MIRYAAWRDIPVDFGSPDLIPSSRRTPTRLVIVDPVASSQVARLDDELCRVAEEPGLALATAASRDRCEEAGVPEAAIVIVGGLDPGDSLRLLGAWLGTELDPVWARSIVESTHGPPGRMRKAAERYVTANRAGRSRGENRTPHAF